ncbi:MAG: hypothetical protein LC777_11050, partial [Actinobacteria bacterium]|nr:hypothetical protein [Actinomycetota bacterium]
MATDRAAMISSSGALSEAKRGLGPAPRAALVNDHLLLALASADGVAGDILAEHAAGDAAIRERRAARRRVTPDDRWVASLRFPRREVASGEIIYEMTVGGVFTLDGDLGDAGPSLLPA